MPNAVITVQNAWIASLSLNKIWIYLGFFKQMHVQTAKLLLFCYFFFLGQYSQRLGPPGQSDLRTWIWSLSDLVIPEHPVVCHSQGMV